MQILLKLRRYTDALLDADVVLAAATAKEPALVLRYAVDASAAMASLTRLKTEECVLCAQG